MSHLRDDELPTRTDAGLIRAIWHTAVQAPSGDIKLGGAYEEVSAVHMKAKFAFLVTLALAGGLADSKTLYVNSATGNDSVSYAANSQASPWRSLGRALWGSGNRGTPVSGEAARAGDEVLVSGGPFTAPGTDVRYLPAFNPVNSGTAASPITIRAVGTVELRTDGVISPVIGAMGVNYVHWVGFVIDERYAPPRRDTGPIVVWSATGTVIDGTVVRGVTQTYGDNHNGVRVEGSTDTTIRNTRISGIRVLNTSTHNGAGIMIYQSQGLLIENNEFLDCGVGIFAKGHDYYDVTIRFNRVRGSTKGIRVSDSHPTMGRNSIYQNVVENTTDSGPGIQVAADANFWTIANNTIVNAAQGVAIGYADTVASLRIANNIVVDASSAVNAAEWSAAFPGPGRNLYFQSSSWTLGSGTYNSFGAWQAAAPAEASSVSQDPMFVDRAARDYRLRPDSPARTLGRDLLDLNRDGSTTDVIPAGAYVTGNEIIGPRTEGDEIAPPQPPSNLQVD